MNLFFDTEFTGLHKDTTLISIGIISENGKKFYAEFLDYDKSQITPWIQENVIDNLLLDGNDDEFNRLRSDPSCTIAFGTKRSIREALLTWMQQFDSDIQFVSDVCHYDFVLLIDLFGTAFDLPSYVAPCCHDINQDIAKAYGRTTERKAFDASREELYNNLYREYPYGSKHNALYDAMVIKAIYDRL